MSAFPIPVIGIIGGIGSGKTVIASELRTLLSVKILDADRIGHEVLKQQHVKEELATIFGNGIFDEFGEIHRPQLAELVFGKEEQCQSARQRLEEVTHPRILQFLEIEISEIKDQQTCDVIVLDAALLLETGWASVCDAIVYLEVPEQIRLSRVLQRGWTEQQFRNREASQLPLHMKLEKSDITIVNDGDIVTVAKKLADWIQIKFPNRFEKATQ